MVNKLTTNDVFNFFKENEITSACSQCGHIKSSIFSTHENDKPKMTKMPLHYYEGQDVDIKSTFGYDVIPLVCDKCGFVRTFLAAAIVKFIEDKEVE